MERFLEFFSSAQLMPHGMCYMWKPEILWLHVFSDVTVAISYFTIPAALYYLASRRTDLYFRPLFLLFSAFIFLCGLTHLMSVFTTWVPYYGPQGLLKLATALVSAATAYVVWALMPKVLAIPGPGHYREQNEQLLIEIATREQAQKELALLNRDLESIVRIKTQELTTVNDTLREEIVRRTEVEGRLKSALEKAEAANVAKSQFLAVMSHEIRTPMTGLIGSLDLLEQKSLDEGQRELAHTANRSAKSLLLILNDIIDLSKLEEGKIGVESIAVSPGRLAAEVISVFSPTAAEKDLEFTCETDSNVPVAVLGDPTRIRQILTNLVGNALKFTETGFVRICVHYEGDEKSGRLIYRVKDSGVGIAPELKTSLFERFTQADSSISRKYGGSGLGLSISKQLTELMNGEIGFESDPGVKTVFWFSLPVTVTEAPQGDIDNDDRADTIDTDMSDIRVLAAEDNPQNQRIIQAILESTGVHVTMVSNGQQAVDLAASKEFDVILMDIHMPELDGIEATQKIREGDKKNADTPIITLTADALTGDEDKFLDAGMNDYLSKPIDINELLQKIQLWGRSHLTQED